MSLETLTGISRRYGADPDYVLAGGGNTSFKDEEFLYVKPSGVRLANIKASDFVKMERVKVRGILDWDAPDDSLSREADVKKMMMDAVCDESALRPSVEAPLHEAIDSVYVVHLHPALVNGLTCALQGAAICAELFPEALWVDYVDPGFTLAKQVHLEATAYADRNGRRPNVIFLQNHGVFVGADTESEIDSIYSEIMGKLTRRCESQNVPVNLIEDASNSDTVSSWAPRLRSILADGSLRMTVTNAGNFKVAEGPLTPDHIVYAKSQALFNDAPDSDQVASFAAEHGYKPLVISVPGKAVFSVGKSYSDAIQVAALAKDAARVLQLTSAFGGVNYLSKRNSSFIENWEVESYRRKVASNSATGHLDSKIAVVTGGAQGFGLGIAAGLIREGATVAIADMNLQGAEEAAAKLNEEFRPNSAFAVEVNISREDSVEDMTRLIVEKCGGIDLFVANAGVLRAGSVKELSEKDWSFVTSVNYSGYFLCVKHVSRVMAAQNSEGGDWTDIVQVNSKSGLVGSNRNGAYAGSKFGTIGLTQSFALELIDDKIKVNSVCPGNFFDGPLWSDPENGLFVQYLRSGKVPGAKNIADVQKFYENKIPMKRGCNPEDVVKAIVYTVEQKYETGQAIPVTGGQVMLN